MRNWIILGLSLLFLGCVGGTEWGDMKAASSRPDTWLSLDAEILDTTGQDSQYIEWYIIPTLWEPDTQLIRQQLTPIAVGVNSIQSRLQSPWDFRLFVQNIRSGALYISPRLFWDIASDSILQLGTISLKPPGTLIGQWKTADSTALVKGKLFIPGTPCATFMDSTGRFIIQGVPTGTHKLYGRPFLSSGQLDTVRIIRDSILIQSGETVDLNILTGGIK